MQDFWLAHLINTNNAICVIINYIIIQRNIIYIILNNIKLYENRHVYYIKYNTLHITYYISDLYCELINRVINYVSHYANIKNYF